MQSLYNGLLSLYETFTKTKTYEILSFAGSLILAVGPYFLAGIILQAVLSSFFKTKKITFKPRNELYSIITAAFIGLVSPLPSYAALPLGISFMGAGIPFSAVMAFAVASPLVNPSVFLITLTQLGPVIALARLIAAFALALAAGFLSKVFFKKPVALPENKPAALLMTQSTPIDIFYRELKGTFLFVGRFFIFSILIAAAVKALIPTELVTQALGGRAHVSLVIAIALGVPFYSCGGAAIPLVMVLKDMGMEAGPILAFFIAGPATKLETLFAYKSLLGIRALIFYLVLTLAGAYAFGLLFSLCGNY